MLSLTWIQYCHMKPSEMAKLAADAGSYVGKWLVVFVPMSECSDTKAIVFCHEFRDFLRFRDSPEYAYLHEFVRKITWSPFGYE